jgi:hypothetical protein
MSGNFLCRTMISKFSRNQSSSLGTETRRWYCTPPLSILYNEHMGQCPNRQCYINLFQNTGLAAERDIGLFENLNDIY